MSALGIQELDEEVSNIENKLDDPPLNGRTRNNSLNELSQNFEQFINPKKNLKQQNQFLKTNKKDNGNYMHEQPLIITHVTLTLGVINNNAYALPTWKYNSIRRNPMPSYSFTSQSKLSRSSSQQQQPRKYFQKSFFLTSSNHVDQFENEIQNNTESATNKAEIRRTKSLPKRNSFDTEKYTSRTQSDLGSEDNRTLNFSPVQNNNNRQSTQDSSCKYQTSVNSSILSTSSSKNNDSKSKSGQSKNIYLDSSRTKTSVGDTSLSSLDTQRSSGRYTYSVAEFNTFKTNLLKNSRITSSNQYKNDTQPLIYQSSIKSGNLNASNIRSIYEAIQRESRPKGNALDAKRSSYIKNLRKTEALLSSSLIIKKLN